MIKVSIIRANEQTVINSLATTDERVLLALGQGLEAGLLLAVGRAQTNYLSGPRPGKLNVITTRLRGSITEEVTTAAQTVTGVIGTNVPYAAYHEFGFHGTVQVKGFNRVTHLVNGKNQMLAKGGKKNAAKLKTGFVGVSPVHAHPRRINYAGKPFLRPALNDTDIAGEINAATAKVAANP